jgi:hypothetical protein
MMGNMKQRTLGLLVAAALVLAQPVMLLADEAKSYDARLEGYTSNVTLDGGSTALMWLLFIGLMAACMGVLFKNANRSHLD